MHFHADYFAIRAEVGEHSFFSGVHQHEAAGGGWPLLPAVDFPPPILNEGAA
jgi:hypothetical protein